MRYFAFMFAMLVLPTALSAQGSGGAIDLRKNGSASSQHPSTKAALGNGFEFRGLKTGMHKQEVELVLGVQVECINTDTAVNQHNSGWLCSDPAHRNLYVALSPLGKVWTIRYDFKADVTESVESFAAAFTAKYGKPTVKQKAYRNGIGNEVTGVEYTWQRGTQELRVDELCDNLDESCVRITDTAYGPKLAGPQI